MCRDFMGIWHKMISRGENMATAEQIKLLMELLREAGPADYFKTLDQRQMGMEAILHMLLESGETVTAGSISEEMNVSTARVAVLLRKMAEKGLVTKETDAVDARVTVVRLTEAGRKTAEEKRSMAFRQMGAVIDRVGMDRMLEFAAVLKEIKAVMKCPKED